MTGRKIQLAGLMNHWASQYSGFKTKRRARIRAESDPLTSLRQAWTFVMWFGLCLVNSRQLVTVGRGSEQPGASLFQVAWPAFYPLFQSASLFERGDFNGLRLEIRMCLSWLADL